LSPRIAPTRIERRRVHALAECLDSSSDADSGRRDKMAGMARRARTMTWNGKDVPPELRELPAGRYVVEAIEDEAPALTAEEEAGIEAALESYRQGRVVDSKRAREIIDAAFGR
jgi:hypothetical protein